MLWLPLCHHRWWGEIERYRIGCGDSWSFVYISFLVPTFVICFALCPLYPLFWCWMCHLRRQLLYLCNLSLLFQFVSVRSCSCLTYELDLSALDECLVGKAELPNYLWDQGPVIEFLKYGNTDQAGNFSKDDYYPTRIPKNITLICLLQCLFPLNPPINPLSPALKRETKQNSDFTEVALSLDKVKSWSKCLDDTMPLPTSAQV